MNDNGEDRERWENMKHSDRLISKTNSRCNEMMKRKSKMEKKHAVWPMELDCSPIECCMMETISKTDESLARAVYFSFGYPSIRSMAYRCPLL